MRTRRAVAGLHDVGAVKNGFIDKSGQGPLPLCTTAGASPRMLELCLPAWDLHLHLAFEAHHQPDKVKLSNSRQPAWQGLGYMLLYSRTARDVRP